MNIIGSKKFVERVITKKIVYTRKYLYVLEVDSVRVRPLVGLLIWRIRRENFRNCVFNWELVWIKIIPNDSDTLEDCIEYAKKEGWFYED